MSILTGALLGAAFVCGFVLGEAKFDLMDYWGKLEEFLNLRDQRIIKQLKK